MGDRTIVALASSPDPDYAFLLPLTALLWRRVGFEPLAIVVGRNRGEDGSKAGGALAWATDPKAKHALEALRLHRIPTYSVAAVDDYPYATTAQTVRQHAAALAMITDFRADGSPEVTCMINDSDWLMPADSDLWPISRAFYTRHEGSQHRCVSYYWNGDNFLGKRAFLEAVMQGRRSQTLPTCHVAMRVRDWRQVYQLKEGENLADAVERTLSGWYGMFPRDGFNVWMSDQDIMTYRLCRQDWFPAGCPPHDGDSHQNGEVLFVGRAGQPPHDRLDRSHASDWDQPFCEPRWVDAHVHRAPSSDAHWPLLRKVIEVLLPEQLEWADQYRAAFAAAGSAR